MYSFLKIKIKKIFLRQVEKEDKLKNANKLPKPTNRRNLSTDSESLDKNKYRYQKIKRK